METALVWFRRDLRLADNAALDHAIKSGAAVIPVYIHAPEVDGDWAPGAASRWWLHESLAALSKSIEQLGSRLIVRSGPELATLRELIRETGARTVCFNRLYEPKRRSADRHIELALQSVGIGVFVATGHLLTEPEAIRSKSDMPYRVFTPFMNRVRPMLDLPAPLAAPPALPPPPDGLWSLSIKTLELLPKLNWYRGFIGSWQPGEAGAHHRLRALDSKIAGYSIRRDIPGEDGTTRLSAHLHFGELSPRQVWNRLQTTRFETRPGTLRGIEGLERELLWREFAHHVLVHNPDTPDQPLDRRFRNFDWQSEPIAVKAWQRGRTGIPIVDAGMRELWTTGFMHNRVRMIVASFLTKHIRGDWRIGARWFWDTLVDADLANNTLNWQWVAGCGADAAPYFRIFNPVLQGQKFDPQGNYTRRWVPELANLPGRFVHAPQETPAHIQEEARAVVGRDYPHPILELRAARDAALSAFSELGQAERSEERRSA